MDARRVPGHMEYSEFAPPLPLRPFVRCLWTLSEERASASRDAPVEPILPDGCMELVVHVGDRFARVRPGHGRELQVRAFLVGQSRRPFLVVPTGVIGVVAARFRIGGATPWLEGLPARSLVEREIPVDELWPASGAEIVERIADASDARSRAAVLARWLVEHMRVRDVHPAAQAAAQWLERMRGSRDVGEIARELHLSHRQVQRLFAEHVGLGPKVVARILRFRRLLSMAQISPGARWTALAARSGYADQAHAIRDFRDFADSTPTAWMADHTPIAAALAGFDP